VSAERRSAPEYSDTTSASRVVGDVKERLAEDYLRRHHLQPVARNHRCRYGELDLIMRDGGTLVFVEVRYRRSDRFGTAAETVDRRKQQRLAAAASHYLQMHPTLSPCRFDVVAVGGEDRIHWIKNAFVVEHQS
jgi:putative endonuclease